MSKLYFFFLKKKMGRQAHWGSDMDLRNVLVQSFSMKGTATQLIRHVKDGTYV